LHFVGAMWLRATALVFYGADRAALKLNRVSDAVQAEFPRPELHRPQGAQALAPIAHTAIDAGVQHTPLCGQPVLGPETLDMDQRALARAEQPMLQCRDRQAFRCVAFTRERQG